MGADLLNKSDFPGPETDSDAAGSGAPGPPLHAHAAQSTGPVVIAAIAATAALHIAAALSVIFWPTYLDVDALPDLLVERAPAVETAALVAVPESVEEVEEEPEPEPPPEEELVAAEEPEPVEPPPAVEEEPEPPVAVRKRRRPRPEPPQPEPEPEPEVAESAADPAPTPVVETLGVPAEDAPASAEAERAEPLLVATAPLAPARAPKVVAKSPVPPSASEEPGASDGADAGVDVAGLQKTWLSSVDDAIHRDFEYPRAARRRGLEGTVVLKIWIDGRGRIVKLKVHTSSGHDVLDEAAIDAVRSVGSVPTPPSEIGWKKRAVKVPFVYRTR